jgi:hypothetical protein
MHFSLVEGSYRLQHFYSRLQSPVLTARSLTPIRSHPHECRPKRARRDRWGSVADEGARTTRSFAPQEAPAGTTAEHVLMPQTLPAHVTSSIQHRCGPKAIRLRGIRARLPPALFRP